MTAQTCHQMIVKELQDLPPDALAEIVDLVASAPMTPKHLRMNWTVFCYMRNSPP